MKKKYAANFFHQKIKIARVCYEPLFFAKLLQNFFQKKKNGHFKNVQNEKFENTFATIFCKNTQKPPFYYPKSPNLTIFLQESSNSDGVNFKKNIENRSKNGYPPRSMNLVFLNTKIGDLHR